MDFESILDNIFLQLNECRLHPKQTSIQLSKLAKQYNGKLFKNRYKTRQGANALENLITDLSRRSPSTNRLKWSFALHMAADEQASALGQQGLYTTEGHQGHRTLPERVQNYAIVKGKIIEIYEFGGTTSEEVLQQLLIDDGLTSRKRRNTLLDPIFKYIGIGSSFHSKNQVCTVIILAEDIVSLVAPEANGKYRKRDIQAGRQNLVQELKNIRINTSPNRPSSIKNQSLLKNPSKIAQTMNIDTSSRGTSNINNGGINNSMTNSSVSNPQTAINRIGRSGLISQNIQNTNSSRISNMSNNPPNPQMLRTSKIKPPELSRQQYLSSQQQLDKNSQMHAQEYLHPEPAMNMSQSKGNSNIGNNSLVYSSNVSSNRNNSIDIGHLENSNNNILNNGMISNSNNNNNNAIGNTNILANIQEAHGDAGEVKRPVLVQNRQGSLAIFQANNSNYMPSQGYNSVSRISSHVYTPYNNRNTNANSMYNHNITNSGLMPNSSQLKANNNIITNKSAVDGQKDSFQQQQYKYYRQVESVVNIGDPYKNKNVNTSTNNQIYGEESKDKSKSKCYIM